jgi:hypothetical protein
MRRYTHPGSGPSRSGDEDQDRSIVTPSVDCAAVPNARPTLARATAASRLRRTVHRARRYVDAGAPVARPMILTTERQKVLHPSETYRLGVTLWLADALAEAPAGLMSLAERKLLEREVTIHRAILRIENGWGQELYRGIATPRDYWRYSRRRLEHDADGWTTALDGFDQVRAHIAPDLVGGC